jgi:hypothetical protein
MLPKNAFPSEVASGTDHASSLAENLQISAGTPATTEAGRRVTTALRSVVTRQANGHFRQIGQFVLVQYSADSIGARTSRCEGLRDAPWTAPEHWEEVSGTDDVAQARQADLACRCFF